MPGLWQEYIGHDNNRDGYMNNMIESQVVTKYELEYYPQVFYNHHQTAPFPARIWIPPFGDPVSAESNPLMWRWVNKFGMSMAAYLDEHDMPGAMHRGRFDDWYPGFIDHVNNFRNTISFLTETALYRYATPHFYTHRRISARQTGSARRGVLFESMERRMVAVARRHQHDAGGVDGGARHGGEVSRRDCCTRATRRAGRRSSGFARIRRTPT